MRNNWAQLKQLQLKGDPETIVIAAKKFIETELLELLRSRGVAVDGIKNAWPAVEENFEVFPEKFLAQKGAIFELLQVLKDMDRPLDWYNGEFIDHRKILEHNEAKFDTVLGLLRPGA